MRAASLTLSPTCLRASVVVLGMSDYCWLSPPWQAARKRVNDPHTAVGAIAKFGDGPARSGGCRFGLTVSGLGDDLDINGHPILPEMGPTHAATSSREGFWLSSRHQGTF
jgi:hypothetical protein